jgi:hypothetical protein
MFQLGHLLWELGNFQGFPKGQSEPRCLDSQSDSSHNLDFEQLCSNIGVVFLSLKITSVYAASGQDVIANLKAYYLQRTFHKLITESDGQDRLTVQEFWK